MIPAGWKSVTAGQLASERTGSVDPAKFPEEIFDLYSIPSYDTGEPEVLAGREIGSSKKVVQEGDILISKIVPHIRRVWIVGPNRGRRQIASGEWISFSDEGIYPGYLRYFLLSDGFHTKFMSTITGVGGSLLRARPSEVNKIVIPLPPLATQQHIARVLEQADRLRKQAQRMENELKLLAQSLFLEMFGDPVENPFNWKESTLGDSCWKITDGTHHSPPLISEGVPYITAKHLKEWGLDFFGDPAYVSQESHEQIYSRCAPEQGDVLYIKDGATTGIAALNEYSFQFSMLSSLALLKPDDNLLLSTYLCHWLNSPKVKTLMLSNMAGAGITRLTLTKIKDARILLPPVEKQKQFELRLREIHSFTSNAREQIRKCNDLYCVLMQRAFNGELTAPERKAA